jgi:hypothetical protein
MNSLSNTSTSDLSAAFPAIAKELQVRHEWVNHSKEQFTKNIRIEMTVVTKRSRLTRTPSTPLEIAL